MAVKTENTFKSRYYDLYVDTETNKSYVQTDYAEFKLESALHDDMWLWYKKDELNRWALAGKGPYAGILHSIEIGAKLQQDRELRAAQQVRRKIPTVREK